MGIAANLALLGYFKYANFFIGTLNLALEDHVSPLNLVLPLAISFFTFQQIAFLVDSYRNESEEVDFINYALFVTFFPQLIAGPIVHHREMMPQFRDRSNQVLKYENVSVGLFILALGLFKKIVIADTFGSWATPGFDEALSLTFLEGWAVSLSYTFQLYFDFSGYTDMAIGAALMFNIRLPLNFNSPYKSLSISEFWKRWHITLGRFFKDYVYIPLGGNRGSDGATYRNLLITFLLVGLWHGQEWTFVLWGGVHGMALVVERLWGEQNIKLPKFLCWLVTFNFINITWVLFRANTIEDAKKVIQAMLGLNGLTFSYYEYFPDIGWFFFGLMLVLIFICVIFQKNSNFYLKQFSFSPKTLVLFFILYSLAFLNLSKTSEFLYFRF